MHGNKKYFPVLKEGNLVYIVADNADCGMGIVVDEINLENGECYYRVYSMRENKTLSLYPYELELVLRD